MFSQKMTGTPNNLTQSDFKRLGKQSEGYSGSDIQNVVTEASLLPLRNITKAKLFKQTPDGIVPATSSDSNAVSCTFYQVDPNQLTCPPVTMADFE